MGRNSILATVQVALLLATVTALVAAGAAERLLRDPFARPPAPTATTTATAPTAPTAPNLAGAAAADPAAAAPAPWLPELRAVMHDPAPGRSLINISGAVLAVGESVHGYRVVKINERSAVVTHDGVRLTLTLDNREAPQ